METKLIKDRKHGAQGQWMFVLYAVLTTIIYILPYTKLRVPYIFAALLMLVSVPFLLLRQRDLVRYTVCCWGLLLPCLWDICCSATSLFRKR